MSLPVVDRGSVQESHLRPLKMRTYGRASARMQQDSTVTLQKLAEECQLLINLKHDATMIQNAPSSGMVYAVAAPKSQSPLR